MLQAGLVVVTLAASVAVLLRAAQRPGLERHVDLWLGVSLLLWGCASTSTGWRG